MVGEVALAPEPLGAGFWCAFLSWSSLMGMAGFRQIACRLVMERGRGWLTPTHLKDRGLHGLTELNMRYRSSRCVREEH